MNKKLYTITEENYKIKGFIDGLEAKSIRTLDQSKMIKNSEDKITYTYFKWWDALQSIIKTKELAIKLTKKLL